MKTLNVRKQFEKALKDISEIRFLYYRDIGGFREIEERRKPKAVEICDRKCDAGSNCCHRFVKRGIPLCVW